LVWLDGVACSGDDLEEPERAAGEAEVDGRDDGAQVGRADVLGGDSIAPAAHPPLTRRVRKLRLGTHANSGKAQ